MTEQQLAYSLLSLGYKDYIASRVLLNNNYPMQGLTLASSAVEKYLKVILALHGKTKKEMGVHLDRWDKLKISITECYTDISKFLDERFLILLGKAYQARYYDNLSAPITISFFYNQLIGELDYTIDFIEKMVFLKNADGSALKSPYQRAFEDHNADLYHNNYLLNGIVKKDFMESTDTGFAVYIDSNNIHQELVIKGTDIKNPYTGTISEIIVEFKR